MEKKPPSKTTAPRHRFVDNGDTSVMPLAEILRQRDALFDDSTPAIKAPSEREPLPPKPRSVPMPASSSGTVTGMTPTPTPRKGTLDKQTQARTTTPRPAQAPQRSAPVEGSSTRVIPKAQVAEPTQMVVAAQVPKQPAPRPATQSTTDALEVHNQVVVFFSTKGGAGATALSLNVAHHYARGQHKTCLVDMDLQLGDALAALALQPRFTIAQASALVVTGGSVSPTMLPKHASGVNVLSQVGSLDDLDKVSSEGMAQLVEDLRGSYDVVVVDGVRDFSDNVLAVLDVADKIAIVTVQEVLAIRRARWSFNILRKIGFDPKDVTIVVNRFSATSEIPFSTIKRIFDPALVMTIPAEASLVTQSLNRGVPLQELNPQHTLTRNIGRLANNLVGNVVPEENDVTAIGKPSFWQRITGK